MLIPSGAQTNQYLQKHQPGGARIAAPVMPQLGICIVIPVHDETSIDRCLQSLLRCRVPACGVEIIVVVNGSKRDHPAVRCRNEKTLQRVRDWQRETEAKPVSVYAVEALDMPVKHAGVGLARKIGMDESVRRLKRNLSDGLIVCLDADCLVDVNYLQAIESHFTHDRRCSGCSVYFEHPLSGCQSQTLYEGMARYELGLRYYKNSMAATGLPFAHYTVGSTIVVRVGTYVAEGGMNRRQAGEDFYFVQKIARVGHYNELTGTTVRPAARVSHRVPFGTGKALAEWEKGEGTLNHTYAPAVFQILSAFSLAIPRWLEAPVCLSTLHPTLRIFLENARVHEIVADIRGRVTSERTFADRFYRWFDAFMAFRFIKHTSESAIAPIPIEQATVELLKWRSQDIPKETDIMTLLVHMRQLDRRQAWGGRE